MEELTKTEERVMQVLWKLKQCFVKDIIDALPDDPKPPYNTISSVVRLLEKKGYVGYKAYGKTYEYFPQISKTEYRKIFFKKMVCGIFTEFSQKRKNIYFFNNVKKHPNSNISIIFLTFQTLLASQHKTYREVFRI